MSDTNENNEEILAKDPSLKRYFKYMLVNRKVAVQFTAAKIYEIVEADLHIPLEPNSVFSKMCIDAFAFYMQIWPDWNLAVKSLYTDQWYNSLQNFLKHKLIHLRTCLEARNAANKADILLRLPQTVMKDINNPSPTATLTLNISIPEKLWNQTDITFKSTKNDVICEFPKISKPPVPIGDSDVYNHPFVSIEFNVPGLIHIQRSSPFKQERFIHSSKSIMPTDSELIHSIEQTSIIPAPKVYTHRLLSSFFTKLKGILDTNYSTAVNLSKRTEIQIFCDEFLSDIFEANVCNATVCEGYHVNFNMSRRTYVLNSSLEKTENAKGLLAPNKDDSLIYKQVLTPIISYSLKNFLLQQEDITKDGYTFFKFLGDIDKTFETAFLHYLNNSMTYKCLLCDTHYILYELKQHLMQMHPLEANYTCSKCFKSLSTKQLLQQRWNHECSVILSSIIL